MAEEPRVERLEVDGLMYTISDWHEFQNSLWASHVMCDNGDCIRPTKDGIYATINGEIIDIDVDLGTQIIAEFPGTTRLGTYYTINHANTDEIIVDITADGEVHYDNDVIGTIDGGFEGMFEVVTEPGDYVYLEPEDGIIRLIRKRGFDYVGPLP